jgi:hypothetical protein
VMASLPSPPAICQCKCQPLPYYNVWKFFVPDANLKSGFREPECWQCSECQGWESLRAKQEYDARDTTKPLYATGMYSREAKAYF